MSRTTLILIIGAGVVAALGVLLFFGRKPAKPAAATLEFWGVDKAESWQGAIAKFSSENAHLTINYRQISADNYDETLINKLAEGKGPDVFFLTGDLVFKYREKIYPLPQDVFKTTPIEFQRTFVDTASEGLVTGRGEILGLPFAVDSLALFYNKDIFNSENIVSPPEDWDELSQTSRKLTTLDTASNITRSGVALGTYDNTSHAFEIVSGIILQSGDKIVDRATKEIRLKSEAENALIFYTSFSDPRKQNYSWNPQKKNSQASFAEGTTAMTFGVSEDVPKILSRNQHISFGVAPFPQLKNSRLKVTYGTFRALTVSRQSKNPYAAWQLAVFLSSKDSAKEVTDSLGLAPARRDLIQAGTKSPELEVFYRQALYAKDWLIPDAGRARSLFREAVDSVQKRSSSPADSIQLLKNQLGFLFPREQ